MSFAKYAQFYKENGFFVGSKIKATITDNSFIGQELVLTKGSSVIRSTTIPASGKVDFFTDESGELTLSSNNGTSTISGTVNVTNYATYNVTLDGSHSDKTREVYPSKESISFGLSDVSDTVSFAYTGDLTNASASSSNSGIATASVQNNVVTVTKAPTEEDGNCVIAVTLPVTEKYNAKSFNINVSKQGLVGEWGTVSNETLVNMVQAADNGELNLRDYWHVGDTRIVTLQHISPVTDSVMNAQPQQIIELVLLYDSIQDTKYELESETTSHRTRPSFVVGLKNCLQNLSPIDYEEITETLSTTYDPSGSGTYSDTIDFYRQISPNSLTKLDAWLNTNFFNALPNPIQAVLKNVKVVYNDLDYDKYSVLQQSSNNMAGISSKPSYKIQKIALPSSREVANDALTYNQITTNRFAWTGGSAWGGITAQTTQTFNAIRGYINNSMDYGSEGTFHTYYDSAQKRVKTRGIGGEACQYYTRTSAENHAIYQYNSGSQYGTTYHLQANAIITSSGGVDKIDKANYASTLAGISPIMFI